MGPCQMESKTPLLIGSGGGLGRHTEGKKVPEVLASEDLGQTPVRRFSPSYVKPIPHEGFTQ